MLDFSKELVIYKDKRLCYVDSYEPNGKVILTCIPEDISGRRDIKDILYKVKVLTKEESTIESLVDNGLKIGDKFICLSEVNPAIYLCILSVKVIGDTLFTIEIETGNYKGFNGLIDPQIKDSEYYLGLLVPYDSMQEDDHRGQVYNPYTNT